MTLTVPGLIDIAMSNPINAQIISRLPSLHLNQPMLTAGCIFQAIWNRISDRPVWWGVNDYDVFYFDEDLSWEAENEVIVAAQALFLDLGVKVELRNQARVHLWFSDRFGGDYPPLRSAKESIDRFLICCTCIGLHIDTGELYAPHGLAELERGVLRMNPNFPQPELFMRKAQSYQARWDWLSTLDPDRG
ncbi:nucleotidyltransferase family protein [Pseudomonas bohemica]|uniref:nucleotidyltransferase family protein n=1 Tax=Pseudomonas bohemica TaxID=2044872 RepID=UPI000DA63D9F|nr:nucleotidyltransferase family protein [Pseudomonas bohemica]